MSSDTPEKWYEKMDITYEEYFGPSYSLPHPGIVNLVREMEQTLGKEEPTRSWSEPLRNKPSRASREPSLRSPP